MTIMRSKMQSGNCTFSACDTARYLSLLFLIYFLSAPAYPFHQDGVGGCDACHTQHNSEDGTPVDPSFPMGNDMMLILSNSTDLCLSCHASSSGAVMGLDPNFPPDEKGAGNFVFLLEDNINDAWGNNQVPISGNHAGHNVASASYGILVDPDHPSAPGGSYQSADLGCTSCHDPHGGNSYRLLRGAGSVDASGFLFTYPAPEAEGISLSSGSENLTNHTAYQSGWSDWCANCHNYFHDGSRFGFRHPVDQLLSIDFQVAYNSYTGAGDSSIGSTITAYLPEVPIEDPSSTTSSSIGATAQSRISCITCHRAHATSAPGANRWDPNIKYLSEDGQQSGSYPIPSPYPEQDQRALCVKCHHVEVANHGIGRPCLACHRKESATPIEW